MIVLYTYLGGVGISGIISVLISAYHKANGTYNYNNEPEYFIDPLFWPLILCAVIFYYVIVYPVKAIVPYDKLVKYFEKRIENKKLKEDRKRLELERNKPMYLEAQYRDKPKEI